MITNQLFFRWAICPVQKGALIRNLILILTLLARHAFAQPAGLDREVSIHCRNQPIYLILEELKQKYGVNFSYFEKQAALQQKVSLRTHRRPLHLVLDSLLRPAGLTYQVAGRQVVITETTHPSEQLPQTITLRGRITDSRSKQAVPYASVAIKGKPVGTVADERGNFVFHFSSLHAEDTLIVSCIGFQSYPAAVARLADHENLDIPLQPALFLLDEVVVSGQKSLSAGEIVRLAKVKIGNNYPVTPYLLEGYFRKYSKTNGRYTYFADAAVQIYDQGYLHASPEQVVLRAVRQSHFHNPKGFDNFLDTRFIYMENAITHTLLQNFVRYQNEALNLPHYQYRLDSLLQQQEDTFYVITATVKHKKYMPFTRKANTVKPAYQLYINTRNYAIHKISYQPERLEIKTHEDVENLAVCMGADWVESYLLGSGFQLVMEYQPRRGVLYPSYIYTKALVEDYNLHLGKVSYVNEYIEELITHQIYPDTAAPPGLPLMKADHPLEVQSPSYDASFWKRYNALPVNLTEVERDLSSGQPLEEQFKNKLKISHRKELTVKERRLHQYRFIQRN